MKESTWDECLSENSATPSTRDRKKAESILRTSEGRVRFFEMQSIEPGTANYVFEGLYSSVLEMLHAFLINEGYKVSNRICLGYYLRDKLKRDDLFRAFDDLRYKRNSLVYYGREMDFETAKQAIQNCKKMIREVKAFVKI